MAVHLAWAMEPVPDVRIELANQVAIDRTLQSLTMSYTNLSKYLRCPLAFYYECVLKVPFLKGDALSFGSAVHNALERYFKEMTAAGKVFPPKEDLIRYFEQSLYFEAEGLTKSEYERRLEQGRTVLSEYRLFSDSMIQRFGPRISTPADATQQKERAALQHAR
jgi:DNA helicase-2/ATP-dependent DNA helicase PcrA